MRFLIPLAAALAFAAPAAASVPRFGHVVVVVFENEERSSIAGNPAAPTFAALAHRYASLTHYDAVAHPSLPNYLALVSGSTDGITSDCTSCVVHARNLADTLAAAGRTWKVYAEDLPQPGYTGAFAGRYAKKHDPFLYFADVAASRARRDRVVPFAQLAGDVKHRQLPDFSLVVPNLCDDMHDCSVATGDAWLRRNVVPLLSSPALGPHGVVFVVFDEGHTGPAAAATSRRSCSARSCGAAPSTRPRRAITGCCARSSRRGGCPTSAVQPA